MFFAAKTLGISVEKTFSCQKPFCAKTICIYSSHSFWVYKFTTTMGEALINLVHQYCALWDKQDTMYKDSNYKEAKWKKLQKFYTSQRCDNEVEVFEAHLC